MARRYQVLNDEVVYLVGYGKTTGNMLFRGNNPFKQGATPTSRGQRVDRLWHLSVLSRFYLLGR